MTDILTIIPSRYESTRLPGKPLVDIAGKPMIVRVLEQATAAALGPVIVATDDERIFSVVQEAGGEAVMTSRDHESGSDRIFEALNIYDPQAQHDVILNLQGDVPLIEPAAIQSCTELLSDSKVDIGTIATLMPDDGMQKNPNYVKAIGTYLNETRMRALYFTRSEAPSGTGPNYLHIGVYAYRRQSLEKFVTLPQSRLEIREKLEQLRALENNMRIDINLIDSMPFDVNTSQDVDELNSKLASQ